MTAAPLVHLLELLVFLLKFWVLPVAVAVCFGNAFWQFTDHGVRAVLRALGPWRTGAADQRIPLVGRPEPAHLAYWWRQMWVDAGTAAKYGYRVVWLHFKDPWLRRTVRNLFTTHRPSGPRRTDGAFVRGVFFLCAPGTFVGALAGASLASLLLSLAFAVLAVLLGLVWLGPACLAVVLRAAERTVMLVRGVRVSCPYPGCYRPVPLAVHHCPGCRSAHGSLRPGRFGALWHVCACGRKLVTTRFAGRGKLSAYCPHCDRPLPDRLATTRVVHLPIVGGTSSGKTMLFAALLEGLHALALRDVLCVEYASQDDRQAAGALSQQLKQADWAHATAGGQPRAFMLTVSRGRRRRLLYLYDPMGESLGDADRVRAQHYLAHADGVLLVVDVLADAGVRAGLSPDDAARASAANPSPQGPWHTYQGLTGELAALSGRRGRLRVAAVVTKRDVLDRMVSLPVLGGQVDDWLDAVGLGRLVRGLGHDFGASRYWSVSAHAATGAGALESEQRRAAEPVLWLLAATGLRVPTGERDGQRRPWPRQRTRDRSKKSPDERRYTSA